MTPAMWVPLGAVVYRSMGAASMALWRASRLDRSGAAAGLGEGLGGGGAFFQGAGGSNCDRHGP